jgi:hypothetical protein
MLSPSLSSSPPQPSRPASPGGRAGSALAALAFFLLGLAAPRSAAAAALQVIPNRVLGMGTAGRGAATGTAGPTLNPSGISLVRSYVVEGAYEYLSDQQGHLAHVAIADSTSASNIGGGLTYTYATAAPEGTLYGAEKLSRHEFGLSLSFPFNDHVAIGATGRYLRMTQELAGAVENQTSGVTFDAGLTIRPVDRFSLGFVGYGLRDLKDPQAPFGFGGGLAVVPLPELILVADAMVDLRTYEPGAKKAVTFAGGAEYTMVSRLAVRAGGGRDGVRRDGFGTLGASALSENGALDVGGRLDFGDGEKAWIFSVSLRLFIPAP